MESRTMGTSTKYSYLSIVLLVICVHISDSCFIRNCPPGGKRSGEIVARAKVPVSGVTSRNFHSLKSNSI